jgi:hypothetical protein
MCHSFISQEKCSKAELGNMEKSLTSWILYNNSRTGLMSTYFLMEWSFQLENLDVKDRK